MAAIGLGQLGDNREMGLLIDALKSDDETIRYMAGNVLGILGDSRAVAPLIAALKDESRRVRRVAARALGQLRDERAVAGLEQVITKDADENICNTAMASLNNILAWSYANAGSRLEEAESLVKRAIALRSDTQTSYETLGWVLYKRGKYEQAITVFEKAKDGHFGSASVHYHLGLAYLKNSQREKAQEELKTAIDLDDSYRERVEYGSAAEK